MNIYLLRHGQTNINKLGRYQGAEDKNLNDFGRKQAELLGERIKEYGIEIIYSSDLKRVVETAEILRKYVKKDIIIREELREINMGAWDTLTLEERLKSHGEYAKEWMKHLEDLPYPQGECGEDVQRRASKIIDEIVEKNYENVAVVTSGGTIMALICSFLGLPQHKRFNLQIDNCSISIVKYDYTQKKFTVKCFNDTAHLMNLIE